MMLVVVVGHDPDGNDYDGRHASQADTKFGFKDDGGKDDEYVDDDDDDNNDNDAIPQNHLCPP